MKKLCFALVLVTVSCLIIFCDEEAGENINLKYAGTIPGGCNTQSMKSISNQVAEKDTVLFSVKNDTLHIFAGLNYTCCAPFETSTTIKGDSILLNIKDKCTSLQSCYCKCMCYYTFDFLFTGFEEKKYNYRIQLTDPRQIGSVIFRQGWIELKKS